MFDNKGDAFLADFGFAIQLESKIQKTKEILGSPLYVAPEGLSGLGLGLKSDIYSLGVTLYCLLFGKVPYYEDTPEKLYLSLRKDTKLDFGKTSDSLKKLILGMLKFNAHERLSLEQIIKLTTTPKTSQIKVNEKQELARRCTDLSLEEKMGENISKILVKIACNLLTETEPTDSISPNESLKRDKRLISLVKNKIVGKNEKIENLGILKK